MKIGIVGSGNIGGTLTRRFRAAGYDVAVANSRGPQSLKDLAQETGAHPATVEEVARDSDVVVVTIPMREIKALPRGLFVGARPDLIVIDTNNYYPRQRDGRIDEIEAGMTESGYVEHMLGHPVVKAFNNIMARHLLENGKPAGAPAASRCRSQATIRRQRPRSRVSSMRSASTRSTPERSPNRGVNSPARPYTSKTTTPRACAEPSTRRGWSGRRSGAQRQAARGLTPRPRRGGIHTSITA